MFVDASVKNQENEPRILIVSVRGFRLQLANCAIYEFEDLICDLESTKLYAPTQEFDRARKIYRLAKYATNSETIASSIASFPAEVVLENEYDLLLVVCDNPWQLHVLEGVKNWRDKCRHKACYVMETWKLNFDDWRLAKEPFKNFDHIFAGTTHCVETYSNVTGLPCQYLAPAVDTLRFCPYPKPPERLIDVCAIGRRPEKTHESLFARSQQDHSFFYYYDTLSNPGKSEVSNPREHRVKLADLLQRSRYNIAVNARFNATSETGGDQEIGYRYFEGAAAGAVLIGMPPEGDAFPHYFDWQDPIIRVNLFEQDILEVIQELNAQPEKVERMRRRNVINSLRKHDWVYRWRDVLAAFDLAPSPATVEREKHLQQLALSIESIDLPVAC